LDFNKRILILEMHGINTKKIVVLELVWAFSSNALPQSLRNLTVNLAISGFIRGYIFLVDKAWDVKKNQHELVVVANLTPFLSVR